MSGSILLELRVLYGDCDDLRERLPLIDLPGTEATKLLCAGHGADARALLAAAPELLTLVPPPVRWDVWLVMLAGLAQAEACDSCEGLTSPIDAAKALGRTYIRGERLITCPGRRLSFDSAAQFEEWVKGLFAEELAAVRRGEKRREVP